MQYIDSINTLRTELKKYRSKRIAFVPTMGNLHAGHIRLVELARAQADIVVVSIFVNPLQFAPDEDYADYPRTLKADATQLAAAQTDIVFTPQVTTLYGDDPNNSTQIHVPQISDILCGVSRPIHFDGVATVVNRLFNIVQPDVALFGQKDFQQVQVIRKMVMDLCLPVEIVSCPTVREKDGLAMSSRNRYLTPSERQIAPQLYAALQRLNKQLQTGARDFKVLQQTAIDELNQAGLRCDYLEIRLQDLTLPDQSSDTDNLVILAAAFLGKARLIDNLICEGEKING
jgi:pantoate--beta-alanine ligase